MFVYFSAALLAVMSVDLGSEYMKIAIVKVGTINHNSVSTRFFIPANDNLSCGMLIIFANT